MQIHELNDFTGELGSGAFIVVDDGEDTGKVSTAKLLSETNEAIDDLDDYLNARIDNIIAPQGDPSLTELADIRLGADGVTYPTAGDAVRGQISDLNSALSFYAFGEETLSTFVSGKRTFPDYESIIADSARITSAKVFSLNPGDIISVSGTYTDFKYVIAGKAFSDYDSNYDSGWKTADFSYTVVNSGVYFVNCAKSDGSSTISPEDATITISVKDGSSEISKVSNGVKVLKSETKKNTYCVFGDKVNTETIVCVHGQYITSTGSVVEHVNYSSLLVPIKNIFIGGSARLTGYLTGREYENTFSYAYFDKDMSVLSSSTDTIYSGHIFNISDVPSGAVYMACNCYDTNHSDFSFQFLTLEKRIYDVEEIIENELIHGELYQIALSMGYTSGYVDRYKVFQSYSGISASEIEVSEDDVYYLTSKNFYGMARAVFYNSNNEAISVIFNAENANLQTLTEVVVPENAVRMLIQSATSEISYVALYKRSLSEKFSVLSAEINDVENAATSPSTTDIPLTFESATGYIDKNKGSNTYSGVTTATINVSAGQKYLLQTRNFWNAAVACLYADNTLYSVIYLANNEDPVKVEIEIPYGITKLVIQRFSAYYPTRIGLITGLTKKPVESILKDKKITVIGDSITEKNFRAKVNWVLWLSDWCGAKIQNLGVGGTGFYNGASTNKNYYARLSSIQASPDIIGVALSWNDFADTSFPVGTATDTGTGSLAGYANDFFSALLSSYPTTPIICYCQSPWGEYHYGEERSESWFNVLSEICALKGIPFYGDMYKGCTLKPWIAANKTLYYTPDDVPSGESYSADDVHPNSEGHKVIARYLYPKFAENLVTTGLGYM